VDNKNIAMQRLSMMGDWLRLQKFDKNLLSRELEIFNDDWKQYNNRKTSNRFGLSITSIDGGLSGIPDLDSLYEYNKENATNLDNQSFKKITSVYKKCRSLQSILKPFLPWLGRSHFLKINKGGFFPEHYDINKTNYDDDEIRLIGFVKNTSSQHLKFCYEDNLLHNYSDGDLFYFNANKRHSVFSMSDEAILLVVTLKFDEELFKVILENYVCK